MALRVAVVALLCCTAAALAATTPAGSKPKAAAAKPASRPKAPGGPGGPGGVGIRQQQGEGGDFNVDPDVIKDVFTSPQTPTGGGGGGGDFGGGGGDFNNGGGGGGGGDFNSGGGGGGGDFNSGGGGGGGGDFGGGAGGGNGMEEKESLSPEFICTIFGGPSCPEDQAAAKVPCLCDSNEPCQCIPFYQCDKSSGSYNEFGVGVIDIRQGNTSCPHYLYKCCKTPDTPLGLGGNPSSQPYNPNPSNPDPTYPSNPDPYPSNPSNPEPSNPDPYPSNPDPYPSNPSNPEPSNPSPPFNPDGSSPNPEPPFQPPSQPAAPTPNQPMRCGQRNPEGIGVRITGDEDGEAQFGEFPWMVAILKVETSEDDRKRNLYQCGGALITPQIVLTAAHCVKNRSQPRQLTVRVGEWDTQTSKEMYRHQDVRVEDIVIHPDYYAGAVHNDVALLFINDPVHIGYHIGTICMPEQDQNFDYQKCFVSGWGKDKFGQAGRYQVILKKLELPVVPHAQCQEQLRKTRLGPFFKLHHSFMCAGGEEGKDTCKGDGGSPLVCPMPADPTRYMLAGTVAWGIDCGLAGVPGVYGNIALFRNWVDEQLRTHNIDSSPYQP